MKTKTILLSTTAAALLFCCSGCGDRKDATVKNQSQSAADSAVGSLQKATEAGAKMASDLAAPGSAKAQELIDSAKKLVGEAKFQEALEKLKAIGAEKLSPTQQAMVDGLKAQIEQALGAAKATAGAAATAVGVPPRK